MRGEQCIEQAGLGGGEFEKIFFFGADGGEEAVFAKPGLGEEADGAVGEGDSGLAFAESGEDVGETGRLAVEIDVSAQLEPVDAGADAQLHRGGLAIELALGLDVPVLGGEESDDAGEVLAVEPVFRAAAGEVVGLAQADFVETPGEGALGGGFADDQSAALRLENGFGRVDFVADDFAVVVEGQLRAEALGAEFIAAGGADAQARFWRGLDGLDLKLGGQVEGREVGEAEHFVEQFIGLGEGNHDGFLMPQEQEPMMGVVVVKQGKRGVKDDQPAGGGEEGAGDGHLFLAAAKQAGECVVLGYLIAAGFNPKFPWRALIKGKLAKLIGIGFGGEKGAAGAADHGQDHALKRLRDAIGWIVGELELVARCAAFEEGEDLLVVRIGKIGEIREGEAAGFWLGPLAVGLAVAGCEADHQGSSLQRRGDIDDIENDAAGGPNILPWRLGCGFLESR